MTTVLFSAAACLATHDTAHAQPNILLVIADDMGLDASPCHSVGDKRVSMPNLETLCQEGLVFDNAYAAPVCSPTRATIITGKYGFRTGIGAAIPRTNGRGLSVEEKSLFDHFNETNYSSAIIGKWHLAGSDASLDHPSQLGVQEYYGIFKEGTRDYFNWDAVHNGEKSRVSGYSTTVFTDRAIDWIAAQNNPWFLWLAFNAPHRPFHVPPQGLHRNSGLIDDERTIRADPLPYYHAALEALDSEMGRLLNSIDDENRRKTIVIFVGDNGTPNQVASSLFGHWRAKGTLFQGGTNVPLVVHGPNVKKGRSRALVNTTDLYATIASFAGLETGTRDSFNIRPILEGHSGVRKYAYVEHFKDRPAKVGNSLGWAIRDAQYKLVTLTGKQPVLFDLKADPFERTDLLTSDPSANTQSKAAELLSAYEDIRK